MAVPVTARAERRFAFAANSFFARAELSHSISLSTGGTPNDTVHAAL
jgi:hypothetical protein